MTGKDVATAEQDQAYDAIIATVAATAAEIAAAPDEQRQSLVNAARAFYRETFERVAPGSPYVRKWVASTMAQIELLVEEANRARDR